MNTEIEYPLKPRRGSGAKPFPKRRFPKNRRVVAAVCAILALLSGVFVWTSVRKPNAAPENVASQADERRETATFAQNEEFAQETFNFEIDENDGELSEFDRFFANDGENVEPANFAQNAQLPQNVAPASFETPTDSDVELASRLQAELRARGVDGAVVERWGSRFWRASGKTPPDENGCVAFCEAFGPDPLAAAQGALDDWRRKVAAQNFGIN